jgi:altronate hydrolase
MTPWLQIHPKDTLAVALQNLDAGFEAGPVRLQAKTPQKQKFLLKDIEPGELIYMYGVPVGKSRTKMKAGEVLWRGNIEHTSAPYSAEKKEEYIWTPPVNDAFRNHSFKGYHRAEGQAGTRNYWLIIPLVFCENRNVQTLQQAFEKELGYAPVHKYEDRVRQWVQHYKHTGLTEGFEYATQSLDNQQRVFKQVDGIRFLTHDMGCGGSREDARTLCKLLAGYIRHPNATIEWLKEALAENAVDKPVFFLDQQQTGAQDDYLQKAIDLSFQGLSAINNEQRKTTPLSKLVLGLKCGGSDGFSGISANPVLGFASDLLVSLGGSSILAEFPELCGVEQELINRCTDLADAKKFEKLMRDYAALSESFGNPFHMNPSEGNIRDGLLTDAMKSAGAARKGGYAPVSGVLDYTEPVKKPGLHLLCTPGNDVEATTGIAGSGATITVFTTGLGTPTGNPVSPMIKISSNSSLYQRMPDIIDFDCGDIISGSRSLQTGGENLLSKIIETASGKQTKAELWQQNDFIPWRKSITV